MRYDKNDRHNKRRKDEQKFPHPRIYAAVNAALGGKYETRSKKDQKKLW